MHEYLKRVGASPQTAKDLDTLLIASQGAQAIVFFADDFPKQRALDAVAKLRRGTSARVVVVSDQAHLFAHGGAAPSDGPITVLRRPTWGWMLLDALQERTTQHDDGDEGF